MDPVTMIILIIIFIGIVVGTTLFFNTLLRRAEDNKIKNKDDEWAGYNNYLSAEDIKKNLEWEKKVLEDKKNGRK